MNVFFAVLHHVAAFMIFAAVVVEFVLLRVDLTMKIARRLQMWDSVLGVSALVVTVAGVLRVVYFEKGPAYYLQSVPFIVKMSTFVLVALLSIYPTVMFVSWGRTLKQGLLPMIDAGKLGRVRMILHIEMTAVVVILICAALMARGYGVIAPR